MRPTISQLRSWNPDGITGAGESAQQGAGVLDLAATTVAVATQIPSHWHGMTKDAASYRVRQETDHVEEVRNVLQQVADEAKDAGTDLSHARAVALREVDAAIGAGFTVTDTGQVSHRSASRAREAATIAAAIDRALTFIDDTDETYGARLDDLRADLAAMIDGQPPVTIPGMGTVDADEAVRRLQAMTIEERRTLLERLSPTDIRRLVQADPRVLGNLDGVPFEQRGIANEINVRNALAAEIRVNGDDSPRARTLRDMLGQKNTTAAAAHDSPIGQADPDDMQAERTIIAFDNTRLGRSIEMVGPLGRGTRNAAVFIPGTGTNLDSVGGSNRTVAWNLAKRTDGPVFTYLDGDLPQEIVRTEPLQSIPRLFGGLGPGIAGLPGHLADAVDESAVDPHFAADMAPRLKSFGQALDAELDAVAPGATTTYIGHSYGGSVLGTAEQLGLRADNVIYASSAGTGVLDGPWHNPAENVRRYSFTAPGDFMEYLQGVPFGPHGADPDEVPGVVHLEMGTWGDGTRPITGPNGHGAYWDDPESTPFRNTVEIIRGNHPDTPPNPAPPIPERPTPELPTPRSILEPLIPRPLIPGPPGRSGSGPTSPEDVPFTP
ncbi:alpha/beta hydrolase [Gordonia sp. NB41Y]|uniref:alpha/beta hydrolase n=1 Tax=Gordonia sp. NB41Y TaxID=875808 RepID=UPI0002BF492A|nr:alpha/beta hydrolase [Gordonia sp. NB41Y]WLP91290.1 alpha/beta hydrolase [Gordonia sp. NB41Y]